MNPVQKSAYSAEIAQAKQLIAAGDLEAGFVHLERAHVIGQNHVMPHVKAHWLMLQVEWRRARLAAVIGQVIRMLLGAVGSAIGVVPVGNTGGTDISMFRRLPVAQDLQAVIDGRSRDEQTRGVHSGE